MAIDGTILQQAGQGDAYILPAFNSDRITDRLDTIRANQVAQQKLAAQAREERDKKLDDLFKWNPEQAWYPHTQQLNNKVKDVYDYTTELKKASMMRNLSPEEEVTLKQKQWDAAVTAKKSKDLQQLYPQLRSDINSTDKYTNKSWLQAALNDEVFGVEGNKDVNEVNFERLGKLTSDPRAFNVQEWTKDFATALPETVNSMIGSMNVEGGSLITDKEVKSKFFDLDPSGNIRYENGKPKLKITDETVNLAMQEPRVRSYVESKMLEKNSRYKTSQDVIRDLMAPYAAKETTINVTKGFSDDEKGKDDEVTMTPAYDIERNFNMSQDSKSPRVKAGWVPQEIRLDGKKMDKPIQINAKRYIDEESNQFIDNQIGDRPIKITRLQQRPIDSKTGRMLIGKKDEVIRNTNPVRYEWFVEATYDEERGKNKITKKILIPYDDVKTDLNSAYSIDLEQQGLIDPLGLKIKTNEDPLGIKK